MKKTAAALVAIVALTLTGCASTPEAGGKNIVQPVESAAEVATGLITKELAKNLPATLDSAADVAEELIENAVKEGQ